MAEKEYIEREVKKITCKDCVGDKFCSTYEKYDESLLKDISGECDVSKLCAYFTPAADVVEVVHGEWKLHGNDDDLGSTYWCSHCYFQVDEELFYPHGYDEEKPYNYCPHCGAKMDGKEATP